MAAWRPRPFVSTLARQGQPVAANNPWRLFDGDGVVGFMAGAPTRVRAALPAGTVVQGLGAYGTSNATVTVFSDEAGTKPHEGARPRRRWPGCRSAGTASRPPRRWRRRRLVIEIDPAPGAQADVRELEIWGSTPERAPAAPGSIAEALLTGLPPSAVSVRCLAGQRRDVVSEAGPRREHHLPRRLDPGGDRAVAGVPGLQPRGVAALVGGASPHQRPDRLGRRARPPRARGACRSRRSRRRGCGRGPTRSSSWRRIRTTHSATR